MFTAAAFSPLSLAFRLAAARRGADMGAVKAAIQAGLRASCTIYCHSADGRWTGSGFHVGGGRVVTAAHVCPPSMAKAPHEITITFDGGKTVYGAQIAASHPEIEAAVLLCDAALKTIPAIPLGDSDALQVGDPISCVSAPEGWSDSATAGIVSNIHQSVDEEGLPAWSDMIFIDADILHGSSGGMVLNVAGEVVGVVMGVVGDPEAAEFGAGQHAVAPINRVKKLLA